MWHLYDGYWKEDLISPSGMMWVWCHMLRIIKTIRKLTDKKRKVLCVLYMIVCMILEPVQFVIYYGTIPLRAVFEWFCSIGQDY